MGLTALSVDSAITRLTPQSMAASITFLPPTTLVWMASNGLYSQAGICLRAAAWTTISTPCMARASRSRSRTSPMKNRRAGCCTRALSSDCFSSSRLKTMRRRGWCCSSTACTKRAPNDPVPPVTRMEASVKSIRLPTGLQRENLLGRDPEGQQARHVELGLVEGGEHDSVELLDGQRLGVAHGPAQEAGAGHRSEDAYRL